MLRKIFITIFTIALIGGLNAQQLHNPISNFGMGDFLDNDQTAVFTTGWANNTFNDRYHVNLSNPASYSFLQSTSFEVGLNGKYSTLTNEFSNYSFFSGQLSHLSLAFPIFSPYNELMEKKVKKIHWGMGLGLAPYSQVSYNYQFKTTDPEAGNILNSQVGSGGIYKLFYNNGLSYKNFSFGIGAQYIFGKIERKKEIGFSDVSAQLSNITALESEVYTKGFLFDFSAMYVHSFNPITNGKKTDYDKEKKLTFGASFQPLSKLKTNISQLDYVYSNQLGLSLSDTISNVSGKISKNNYNSAYGAGISYQDGSKWKININYDAQLFDEYAVAGLDANYKNTGVFKVGGEWCPEPNSYTSFLKRSKYRAGFRTGTLPLTIDGSQAKVVSGTIGFGFPVFVNRQISHVNIGLEMGKKTYGSSFSEQFYKLQIGFNLNDDLWFLKRKFE